MKTVCGKHGIAYEVSQGCLYCTPISSPIHDRCKYLIGDEVARHELKADFMVRVRDQKLAYTESRGSFIVTQDGTRFHKLNVDNSHCYQGSVRNPIRALLELARGLGVQVSAPTPLATVRFSEIRYNYIGNMLADTWFGQGGSYYSHSFEIGPEASGPALSYAYWALMGQV